MATGLSFNIFGKDVSAGKAIKHVETQADESSSAIGEHFKKLGEVMAEAFAAEKIIEFGKSAFEAAEAAEKTSRQTEAVIKSTGGSAHITAEGIKELSHQIGSYAGMSDQSVQAGENMLLTFKNVRNEVGKGNDIFDQTSKTATDLAVSMGMQLPNAMRLVGRAVNDPVKGLSILTRYGITFTDAQKKQMAQLVATGHAMQAQKMVLAELNQKFAGSAAAQATPADKARAAWANMKVEIGDKLMPVVDQLFTFFTAHVIPVLVTLAGWISKNIGWLLPLAGAVAAVVAVWKAWTMAQAALNVVMDANPIVLVAVAIAALVAALILAWKKSQTFRDIVLGVFDAVKHGVTGFVDFFTKTLPAAFHAVVNWVKANWPILLSILTGPIGAAVIFIIRHWDQVKSAATGLFHWVRDKFDAMVSFITGLPGRIGRAAMGMWDGVKNAFRSAIDWIIRGWNSIQFKVPGFHLGPVHFGGFTLGLPDIPLLAQGTGFFRSRSGLAVVGDAGPELVRLPTGAQVLNRQAAVSHLGGGGGVMRIEVEVKGGLATEVGVQRALISALEHAVGSNGMHMNISKGIR